MGANQRSGQLRRRKPKTQPTVPHRRQRGATFLPSRGGIGGGALWPMSEAMLDAGTGMLPWIAASAVTLTLGTVFAPATMDASQKAYYGSSVLALAHGILVSALSLAAGLESGFWSATTDTWDYHVTTPATARCIHIFLAFLLTDLMPLLYYRKVWSGTGMYIGHHVLSFISWGDCAINGTCHQIALGLLLVEATSPFVNGRYFLSTHGLKSSTLYVVNGFMMMISFLVLRVVGMGLLGVKFLIIDRAEFFSLPMTTTCAALVTAPTHGAPSSPATCDVPWGARDAGFIWCRSSSSGTGCSSRGSRRSSAA